VSDSTGVWWPVSIWAGAVPVAGVAGWMISLVGLAGEAAVAKIARTSRCSLGLKVRLQKT